jgi:hypothetical protein
MPTAVGTPGDAGADIAGTCLSLPFWEVDFAAAASFCVRTFAAGLFLDPIARLEGIREEREVRGEDKQHTNALLCAVLTSPIKPMRNRLLSSEVHPQVIKNRLNTADLGCHSQGNW